MPVGHLIVCMKWIQRLKYRGCLIVVDTRHRGFRNLNAMGAAGFTSEGKTEQVSNQNPQVRGKMGNLGVVHKLRDHVQGPPEYCSNFALPLRRAGTKPASKSASQGKKAVSLLEMTDRSIICVVNLHL